MPIVRNWSGDGLSPGTLTTSSAGTGDNAFNTVTGGGITIVNSGERAPRIQFAASDVLQRVTWNFAVQSELGLRWVEETPSVPTANQSVAIVQGLTTGQTVQSFRVERTNAGTLRLRNTANAIIGNDSAGSIPYGVPVRYEVQVTTGGVLTASAYSMSGTLYATTTASGAETTHDGIRIGGASNVVGNPTHFYDDIILTNTAAIVGPTTTTLFPTAITAPSWTQNGSSLLSSLTDQTDATYAESPANPSAYPMTVNLGRLVKPTTTFICKIRGYRTAGTAGSLAVTLVDGATTVSTATVTGSLGTVLGDLTATFPANEVAAITEAKWNAGTLKVLIVGSVT